jgi:hypothetical protein
MWLVVTQAEMPSPMLEYALLYPILYPQSLLVSSLVLPFVLCALWALCGLILVPSHPSRNPTA